MENHCHGKQLPWKTVVAVAGDWGEFLRMRYSTRRLPVGSVTGILGLQIFLLFVCGQISPTTRGTQTIPNA